MDTLDVILTNTISYMAGIFTGLFVSYYIKERKKKENKVQGKDVEKEKDYDSNITDKYSSPIQTALAYPSAPPPMSLNPATNPDYIEKKIITITTE